MRFLGYNATDMRWRPGPGPRWAAYSAPPIPLATFEGGEGREW